jgi:hypothetical protein
MTPKDKRQKKHDLRMYLKLKNDPDINHLENVRRKPFNGVSDRMINNAINIIRKRKFGFGPKEDTEYGIRN